MTGLKADAYYLALGLKKLQKNLLQSHVRQLGTWARWAEQEFDKAPRARPQEMGIRAEGEVPGQGRQTKNFTFGSARSHASMSGVLPPPRKGGLQMSFGFPDVERADRMTKGAWRSQEFGQSAGGATTEAEGVTIYEAAGSPFPLGKTPHRLPLKWKYVDRNAVKGGPRAWKKAAAVGEEGVLVPLSRKGGRFGRGYEGKHFIQAAANRLQTHLKGEYQQVMAQAWR